MYIDNVKKLRDELEKLIWVDGDIAAARDDKQDCDLDNLISIMEKYISGFGADMFSTDDYSIECYFANDPWPYADTIDGLKKRLKKDYARLKTIYKRVLQERKNVEN